MLEEYYGAIFLLLYRHRRNLLTFEEVTSLYRHHQSFLLPADKMSLLSFVILYFLVESALMFLMYRIQDSIGQDNVFYIVHTIYALFDIALMVTNQVHLS